MRTLPVRVRRIHPRLAARRDAAVRAACAHGVGLGMRALVRGLLLPELVAAYDAMEVLPGRRADLVCVLLHGVQHAVLVLCAAGGERGAAQREGSGDDEGGFHPGLL